MEGFVDPTVIWTAGRTSRCPALIVTVTETTVPVSRTQVKKMQTETEQAMSVTQMQMVMELLMDQ